MRPPEDGNRSRRRAAPAGSGGIRRFAFRLAAVLLAGLSVPAANDGGMAVRAQSSPPSLDLDEPFVAAAHGAFYDRDLNEIAITVDTVYVAQEGLIEGILSVSEPANAAAFEDLRKEVLLDLEWWRIEAAFARTGLVRWLLDRSAGAIDKDMAGLLATKNEMIAGAILVAYGTDYSGRGSVADFLSPDVLATWDAHQFTGWVFLPPPDPDLLYLSRCESLRVPRPPDWVGAAGGEGWQLRGVITETLSDRPPGADPLLLYLHRSVPSRGNPVPPGVCLALARLGLASGKVEHVAIACFNQDYGADPRTPPENHACFWMNAEPELGVMRFPMGVDERRSIEDFAGAVSLMPERCPTCHRGSNPFLVHPSMPVAPADLVSPYWYVPVAPPGAEWENPGPSAAFDSVPPDEYSCAVCHRLPEILANDIPSYVYCRSVLERAVQRTMPPPDSPPGAQFAHSLGAIEALCRSARPTGPR